MTPDNSTEKPTPQEFLRDKYKLADFQGLTLNGKSWLEIMEEYRLTFDESARANYYEDKIDMLNNHLQQRDEEIRDLHWHKKAYQKHIDDLVRRLYPVR